MRINDRDVLESHEMVAVYMPEKGGGTEIQCAHDGCPQIGEMIVSSRPFNAADLLDMVDDHIQFA